MVGAEVERRRERRRPEESSVPPATENIFPSLVVVPTDILVAVVTVKVVVAAFKVLVAVIFPATMSPVSSGAFKIKFEIVVVANVLLPCTIKSPVLVVDPTVKLMADSSEAEVVASVLVPVTLNVFVAVKLLVVKLFVTKLVPVALSNNKLEM